MASKAAFKQHVIAFANLVDIVVHLFALCLQLIKLLAMVSWRLSQDVDTTDLADHTVHDAAHVRPRAATAIHVGIDGFAHPQTIDDHKSCTCKLQRTMQGCCMVQRHLVRPTVCVVNVDTIETLADSFSKCCLAGSIATINDYEAFHSFSFLMRSVSVGATNPAGFTIS